MRTKEEIADSLTKETDNLLGGMSIKAYQTAIHCLAIAVASEISRLEQQIEELKNPGKGYKPVAMRVCPRCNVENYRTNSSCYQCGCDFTGTSVINHTPL